VDGNAIATPESHADLEGRAGGRAGGLARGKVSSVQVAVISIAASGPAASIALTLPAMAGFAGEALVFTFVLMLGIILMLTNTFGEFARRLPSAGSLLAWNEAGLGSNVGFVFGWFFVGGYLLIAATGFAAFGGFAHDYVLTSLDADVPWWIFTAACFAYITFLAWRGIAQTVTSALILLGVELGVLLLLAVWLLVSGHADLDSAPLDPGSSPDGWTGVGLALAYAVLSIVGYEEAATLGEEAKDSRRSVRRGLWIAGIFMPMFFLFVSYVLVTSYDPFSGFADDPLAAQTLATGIWHSMGGLITVVVILSVLAFAQTSFNAGVRVIYSLGRAKLLPTPFAQTHDRHSTPTAAIVFFGAITITLAVVVAALEGPLNVFAYFGFMTAVGFLVIYATTNIGLISYIQRRHRSEFSPWRHLVLPLGATAGVLFPLYKIVNPLPDDPYPLLVGIVIGWAVVGVLLLVYLRTTGRADIEEVTRAFAAQEDPGVSG
jgi:amino acid transporter